MLLLISSITHSPHSRIIGVVVKSKNQQKYNYYKLSEQLPSGYQVRIALHYKTYENSCLDYKDYFRNLNHICPVNYRRLGFFLSNTFRRTMSVFPLDEFIPDE